jgi:monoamine oxidase
VEWNGYQWDLGGKLNLFNIDISLGQWVGPTQDRMYKLINELGMKTFPQTTTGKKGYVYRDGSIKMYSGTIPPLPILGLLEFQTMVWGNQALVNTFPLDRDIALKDHPNAKEW